MGRMVRLFCLILLSCGLGMGSAMAGTTQVAVASNFMEPAKEIAAAFKVKTGHEATLSFGASGQFYSQISHGAPYEVFLSADLDRPEQAEKDGFAVSGSRFTYALGRLALYSALPGYVDPKGAVLAKGDFQHLAMADPAIAPYGLAAVQSLRTMGLYDRLKPKIVEGSSIAQTFQFVQTGAAELGFVALSQVINRPDVSYWTVPAKRHSPIIQQAVLLKVGEKDPAAKAFIGFLKSPEAIGIIRRYGYEAP
jgi:molybdate transport system substrate-binding protein